MAIKENLVTPKVIAGGSTGKPIRDVPRLVNVYGGK
jgi:hypothetical protein